MRLAQQRLVPITQADRAAIYRSEPRRWFRLCLGANLNPQDPIPMIEAERVHNTRASARLHSVATMVAENCIPSKPSITYYWLISSDPIFASIEAHRIADACDEVILGREPIGGAAYEAGWKRVRWHSTPCRRRVAVSSEPSPKTFAGLVERLLSSRHCSRGRMLRACRWRSCLARNDEMDRWGYAFAYFALTFSLR